MKKTVAFLVSCICFVSFGFSQESITDQNYFEQKVEEFIITKQQDSALIYLSKVSEDIYVKVLARVAKGENVSYDDYYTFLSKVTNKNKLDFLLISNFIDDEVKVPKDKNTVNGSYFNIKYNQISEIRDNGDLDSSSDKKDALENYLNQFDQDEQEVKTFKAYNQIHDAVLSLIEKDIETGKKILNNNLAIAREYNDNELEIASLYFLADFLTVERKLDEFIEISEKSLLLEEQLPEKSRYYQGTIEHLINAYIFKGGYDERVQTLLDQTYNSPSFKANSYSLYAQYLSTLAPDSEVKREIFKKFNVKNSKEFSEYIIKESRPLLNNNEFYFVLKEVTNLLVKENLLKEAIGYQKDAVLLTRKIYSEDLSKSIANYKTKQAVKEKELEITHAKEQSNLYFIIITLIGILLTISLFVLVRLKKQSKLLKEKNNQINKTLKEKELLVKEVHHRVKNNFQIVSSLLELQSKGIEDEKALALANEAQNRVKSMALIHQKLYQNEAGLIDFDEYVNLLVKELSSLYAIGNTIETNVSSKNMMFDVDTAIPLGLIINELITNAYKYVVNSTKKSQLNISISKWDDTSYKLVVSDNGNGLDPLFDVKNAKSLGLRLVNRLVKQLHGTLELTNGQGARFEIIFKDVHARRQVE